MNRFTIGVLLLFLITGPGIPVSRSADFDAGGGLRVLGTAFFNPDVDILYPSDSDTYLAGVFRLMADIMFSPVANLEINTVHDLNRSTAPLVNPAFETGGRISSAYRYSGLEWEWMDKETDNDIRMGISAVDRLNVRLHSGPLEIRLGRQPVNLTACFFLTPNDFFQPFSAQSFNRIYKPGVDAVRIGYAPGPLTEISLIGAAGYDADDKPDWEESAAILRGLTSLGRFQVTVLGGKLAGRYVIGASCQGEIGMFGVRAEGNLSKPHEGDRDEYVQFSIGVDRRFTGSLHLFGEYMYLGNGAGKAGDYAGQFSDPSAMNGFYPGRHYLSLGATSEFHPLVNGGITALTNLQDPSLLLAADITVSLADEAEGVIGVQWPVGKEPESDGFFPDIQSEYGMYPGALFVEVRYFF